MLLVFRSRQHAVNFVDIMAENGIKGSLVPTPKELSLGCGFSVRFENGFLSEVRELMKRVDSRSNGLYRITVYNGTMKFTKTE